MRLSRSDAEQNLAPHQYAKHMPNAAWRYKLLLISVLLAAAKFSISPTSQEWDSAARFWDESHHRHRMQGDVVAVAILYCNLFVCRTPKLVQHFGRHTRFS